MTAIAIGSAKALLRRKTKSNRLAQQAVGCLATTGVTLTGGVIPIEDAVRTYDRRLRWAREQGLVVAGGSKLLTRLRQSGLERVAVFSVEANDAYLIFFSDPDYETLLGNLGVPRELAKTADV